MTTEEEIEFKKKISETIIPIAINMTEDKIRDILEIVQRDNPQLPEGFANMLLEQIIIKKRSR
ncbi:MAG: hypothetical protein ACERKK_06285 [Poseidonibacter sp.]|uniref:hypothetical protein n=1 Tax=Poseidonibacter sp. TaxID=2321188 RepID=UPI00359EEFDE